MSSINHENKRLESENALVNIQACNGELNVGPMPGMGPLGGLGSATEPSIEQAIAEAT